VATLVTVQPGWEAAIAAALGGAADAVAVRDLPSAINSLDRLRDGDGGRAHLLVGDATQPVPHGHAVPAGCTEALSVLTGPPEVEAALAELLAHVVLVDDL